MARMMRAISIPQPDATLVAIGAKQFVVHKWSLNYTGPLAIHASAEWNQESVEYCRQPEVKLVLKAHGYDRPSRIPRGCFVALGEMYDASPLYDPESFIHLNMISGYDLSLTRFVRDHWCYSIGSVQPLDPPLLYQPSKPIWKLSQAEAMDIDARIRPVVLPWSNRIPLDRPVFSGII